MRNLNPFQKIMSVLIILINLGTLLFVAPLSQNLSDLGNAIGHRLYLIVWATSAAIFFFSYTHILMKTTSYKHKVGILLLYISCIAMVISVLLPYAPYQYPVLSKWHIRIAMGATLCYIFIVYHYLFDLIKKDYTSFFKTIRWYSTLVIFDTLLYILYGGVSTLLEISFTIGMACILPYLLSLVKPS